MITLQEVYINNQSIQVIIIKKYKFNLFHDAAWKKIILKIQKRDGWNFFN